MHTYSRIASGTLFLFAAACFVYAAMMRLDFPNAFDPATWVAIGTSALLIAVMSRSKNRVLKLVAMVASLCFGLFSCTVATNHPSPARFFVGLFLTLMLIGAVPAFAIDVTKKDE